MHPRMQRLVIAATVVALTACGRDVPVSPTDILAPSEADGTTANYAVVLADGTTQISVGEVVTLRASTTVRRSRTIRWSTTNTSVVSVSSVGTITGRAAGAATVTALGSNGSRSTFPISVVSGTNRTAPVVARVDITAPATSMAVGGTLALSATARDSAGVEVTGKTVSWSASTGSALSVSTVGVVTALATGTQDVRATVDGVVGTRTITVGGATPSVTSFVLSPKTGASLTPWQNRQFTSSVTWSDAATRAVSVTYSTNGGYIDSNGWFTAGGVAGTFMVIANCACGRADTAAVIVSSTTTTPTAQLTKLTISPKSVSLAAGASQQFSATANWSTGATTLPPMTYSASAGSVSNGGLYVAPSTAGTYRVIVAHTGGSLRDTATIVVGGGNTNDVVTPPPPAPTGLFFQDGFESGARTDANGFTWKDATFVTVSRENAYTGSFALRFEYGPNAPGADGWSEQRFDMGQYLSDVTMEYMLFIPANFRHRLDDGATNNKFLMLWRDNYGSLKGTWQIGWEFWRGGDDLTSTARFMSSRWDCDYVTDGCDWPNPAPVQWWKLINGAAGPLTPGSWNKIKFRAKAASNRSASDGVATLWINDAVVFNYSSGRFHNFNPAVTDAVLRNGYLMGWANSGFAEKTVFYLDDVKFYR